MTWAQCKICSLVFPQRHRRSGQILFFCLEDTVNFGLWKR